jgi:hypothetical protein
LGFDHDRLFTGKECAVVESFGGHDALNGKGNIGAGVVFRNDPDRFFVFDAFVEDLGGKHMLEGFVLPDAYARFPPGPSWPA